MLTVNKNKNIKYVFQKKKRSVLFQERYFLLKHSLTKPVSHVKTSKQKSTDWF